MGQADKSCHKVNQATILLAQKLGGLGLINLFAQVHAIGARTIIWAIAKGNHFLQRILQINIKKMSLSK